MTWEEYYDKINDWAVSTAVSKLSSLEDIGSPEEVADVINVLAFEDEKGATRLLKKAIKAGVKFRGEQLADIYNLCSEESFQEALSVSAGGFTAKDLEELYGILEDEEIITLSKRYNLAVPEYIAEDYEEELCQDVNAPIFWTKFYNSFSEWSEEFAIARSRALVDFGNEDEVIEVVNALFSCDEYEASQFIKRALYYGVKFGEYNLMEISCLCDEETMKNAVIASRLLLNEDNLETLYGIVDDEVIIDVAKKRNLKLPEALREEEESELEDFRWQVEAAIDAANYAINCLVAARNAYDASSSISVMDMFSNSFFPSYMKHAALQDAERELQIAGSAIDGLNHQLRVLKQNSHVGVSAVKLSSAIDMWFDSGFMDCLVHTRINKVQRNIGRTISRIEAIKWELERI